MFGIYVNFRGRTFYKPFLVQIHRGRSTSCGAFQHWQNVTLKLLSCRIGQGNTLEWMERISWKETACSVQLSHIISMTMSCLSFVHQSTVYSPRHRVMQIIVIYQILDSNRQLLHKYHTYIFLKQRTLSHQSDRITSSVGFPYLHLLTLLDHHLKGWQEKFHKSYRDCSFVLSKSRFNRSSKQQCNINTWPLPVTSP